MGTSTSRDWCKIMYTDELIDWTETELLEIEAVEDYEDVS